MPGGKRRYQIFLQNEQSIPIDVYLVSQETPDTLTPDEETANIQQAMGIEIGSPPNCLFLFGS